MKKIFFTSLLSLSLLLSLGVAVVHADPATGPTSPAQTGPTGPIKLDNPFKGPDSLFNLLQTIIDEIVMPIGGVLAVLAFIYSGFKYVTARGDTSKIKDAHNALLYTAVGTAVLMGAWMLSNVICQTINKIGGPSCWL